MRVGLGLGEGAHLVEEHAARPDIDALINPLAAAHIAHLRRAVLRRHNTDE